MSDTTRLSVVMPAFNEEGVVARTLEQLDAYASAHPDLKGSVEVIVVSDGSADGTFAEATDALERLDLRGVVVELAQNVGSHGAIRCGLNYTRGEHVAILSADGQEPLETLGDMLDAFHPGVDIVWARRSSRKHDSLRTRFMARTFYSLFRRLTGLDLPPAGIDFVMITRRIAEIVRNQRERNASVFLMIFNLGFGQAVVDYDRAARIGGRSKWTRRSRMKMALDMLTGFSAAPIRLISLVGVIVGLAGLGFGGFTTIRALAGSETGVPGWASLMVVTSLMGGLLLIGLGMLGEYVWRTLDEVRGRPLYLESRTTEVGRDDPNAA